MTAMHTCTRSGCKVLLKRVCRERRRVWTATLDRLTVAGRMPRQLLGGTGLKEAMAQAQTLGGALLLPAAIFTYALQVGWLTNRSTCIFAPSPASSCSHEWLIVTHAVWSRHAVQQQLYVSVCRPRSSNRTFQAVSSRSSMPQWRLQRSFMCVSAASAAHFCPCSTLFTWCSW